MKKALFGIALLAATPAFADRVDPNRVRVYDHTRTLVTEVPTNAKHCYDMKKPVYGSREVQGDAGEAALLGMIIGGLIGKGVTGDDGGAAAGAIMGGVIGADKGSKPSRKKQIVGHEYVNVCEDVIKYERTEVEIYSHSTIRFFIDGKRYVVEFQK